MEDVGVGIKRITFPLPFELDHVHCYLLPGDDGWTLVDCGIGYPGLAEQWRELLAPLDQPVLRIVITHFHPDHVGGAADAAAATGASVHQGVLDHEQCERVWGSPDWEGRLAGWFRRVGVPDEVSAGLQAAGAALRPLIRFPAAPEPLHPGDTVDGWLVEAFPGHADGHLCLFRDGVMIAGDHLLPRISPTIGLYPDARPDPLGDYLGSLERTVALGPRLALPGHGDPISDPAARAGELIEHHRDRLDRLEAELGRTPRTGYDLSLALFGDDLRYSQRRFAVAETLAHCERLVFADRAARADDGRSLSYTAA